MEQFTMELSVKTEISDIVYKASYEKPAYDFAYEQSRVNFSKMFVENYGLRLNDIKLDSNTVSEKFIYFSKFDNPSFFDLNLGLEELSATLRRVRDKNQAKMLFGKLNEILGKISLGSQYWNIVRQLSTKGDAKKFLRALNPKCPKNFESILDTNGVYYTLKYPNIDLTMRVTLVDSAMIQNGLYLNVEYLFLPNKTDFLQASEIVEKYDKFIVKSLDLKLTEEV